MSQDKDYSLLIIDDEEGIRHGLKVLFKKHGFTVFSAGKYKEAVDIVKNEKIDVAIIDVMLKGNESGIELVKALKQIEPDITAVMIELKALKSENAYLKHELIKNYMSYDFLTNNKELKLQLEKADKIKNSGATVLINGESGTGKEVLARYIHFTSVRKTAKFVSINCAALSESLLLSEFFGHEKGAFIGALERKIGRFEIADGGTLFLDEIGDMSLDVQAKLLFYRGFVLQDKCSGFYTVAVS